MLSKSAIVCGIAMIFFAVQVPVVQAQMKTSEQIFSTVDEVLQANPMRPGEVAQIIKLVERQTVNMTIVRVTEGAEFKLRLNKANEETIYVLRGEGQMLVNEKWVSGRKSVEVRAGSIYFNPMTNVMAVKNAGSGELVILFLSFRAERIPRVIY